MGGTFSTHAGRGEIGTQFEPENLKKKAHVRHLGVHGRIMALKRTINGISRV
jgi:hypothetical protein